MCKRASYGQSLALPSRKSAAPFSHEGFIGHRHTTDLFAKYRQPRGLNKSGERHIRIHQRNVLSIEPLNRKVSCDTIPN